MLALYKNGEAIQQYRYKGVPISLEMFFGSKQTAIHSHFLPSERKRNEQHTNRYELAFTYYRSHKSETLAIVKQKPGTLECKELLLENSRK
jgi:hypothetical protein